jgi:hypothetical protein
MTTSLNLTNSKASDLEITKNLILISLLKYIFYTFKKIIIVLASILVFLSIGSAFVFGQDNKKCGNTYLYEENIKTNPHYTETLNTLEQKIQSYLNYQKANPDKMQVVDYVVPVVFHIIHEGEAIGIGNNLSDSLIITVIQGLNDRFSNENGMGVDTHIQFCLATNDPSGNPTTGINRVDGSILNGYVDYGMTFMSSSCPNSVGESFIKSQSRWPNTSYLNIWVVNEICPNIGGYATYPASVNPSLDGVVLASPYVSDWNYKIIAHEVGHYLSLIHTFEGDDPNYDGIYTCPLSANGCGGEVGDCCGDTPIHTRDDTDTINPCTTSGIWDNSRINLMSYNWDLNMLFTQDQSNRMEAIFAVSPRSSLLNSNGCQFVGIAENIKAKTTLTLHPNPSGSIVKIQTNAKELYLTDLTGKILYSTVVHSGETNLDVTGLPAGVFFIHTSEGRAEKLIVQH